MEMLPKNEWYFAWNFKWKYTYSYPGIKDFAWILIACMYVVVHDVDGHMLEI